MIFIFILSGVYVLQTKGKLKIFIQTIFVVVMLVGLPCFTHTRVKTITIARQLKLQNLKLFLELDHKGPVGFQQIVTEIVLACIDTLAGNLKRVREL